MAIILNILLYTDAFSYEIIQIQPADVQKYSFLQAQLNPILNNVSDCLMVTYTH